MKKMRILSIFAALAGLFLVANVAFAAPILPTIPLPAYMEFDLDNWTRLYRDNVPLPLDPADPSGNPIAGDMSRAFITFGDISPTIGPGGPDLPPAWVAGFSDGTYLHGWEDNVVIRGGTYLGIPLGTVPQGDGSTNLYFDHNPLGGWEFEVYQTQVTTLDFITDSNYLQGGPTTFDAIKANIIAPPGGEISEPFVRGLFAESQYFDATLAAAGYDEGFGPGYITAVAGINVTNINLVGGEWVNQVRTPFGLGVNAFVDVDPTWGIGGAFLENFYRSCFDFVGDAPDGGCIFNTDPYDLAIQNVRLNSEATGPMDDGEGWVISDDGVRGATIPEPATMLLLGTGLVGLGGAVRRRKTKKA